MDEKKTESPENDINDDQKPMLDHQASEVEDKVNIHRDEIQTNTLEHQAPIAQQKKAISTKDKIALAGFIVNVIMTIFTYFLFREATASTKIANKAMMEAMRANSISEKNYVLAKDALEQSNQSEQAARELNNKSLQTQINTLKENQKQFNISNEPILSILNSKIEVFEASKPLLTRIQIENLGKYPCKVIESKVITNVRISPPSFKEVYSLEPDYSDLLNKYILNSNPVPSPFATTIPINENQFKAVSNGNYFIYLTGYIKYQNIISKKVKTYKFQLKMKPGYESSNIINENN